MWTQKEAIGLARLCESIAPQFGAHVALTGGCLYKDGSRKDCDILFYRIRQVEEIDSEGLFVALAEVGLVKTNSYGWCHKAKYHGKSVDVFFPESNRINTLCDNGVDPREVDYPTP